MKKIFMSILTICLSLSVFTITSVNVVNAKEKNNIEQIEVLGEKISVTSSTNENIFIVETITEKGEKNVFVYDKEKEIATLNGKEINIKVENYVELEHKNIVKRSTDPYTPVYVNTQKISFKDHVSSAGKMLTLIGGLIGIHAIAVKFKQPEIVTKVGAWLSTIGVAALGESFLFSGYFTYKLYRTKEPVQFGAASWPQIAYRYQDSTLHIDVLGHTMVHSFNDVGDWWYGSKPF